MPQFGRAGEATTTSDNTSVRRTTAPAGSGGAFSAAVAAPAPAAGASAAAAGGAPPARASQVRWVPDEEAHQCALCHEEFNLIIRKHHCRHCGEIFCDDCSSRKCLLPANFGQRDPQRVCNGCWTTLMPLQDSLRASNSNCMRPAAVDTDSAMRFFNSPIAVSMEQEIEKATFAISNFSGLGALSADAAIPLPLLRRAKGLAFLTVLKVGFIWTGKMGTGLVISRLPDGSWSAPSAIGTAGMGFGAQVGGEVTDYVILLNDQSAVNAFAGKGQVALGVELGVAAGPVGRSAGGDVRAGDGGAAAAFTYSHSKGFFAGISLEGSVISARPDCNTNFYGGTVEVSDLLGGVVPPPPAARPLYMALDEAMREAETMGDGLLPPRAPGGGGGRGGGRGPGGAGGGGRGPGGGAAAGRARQPAGPPRNFTKSREF